MTDCEACAQAYADEDVRDTLWDVLTSIEGIHGDKAHEITAALMDSRTTGLAIHPLR